MISERVIFSRIDWRRSTSLCLSNFTSSGHREERLVKIHWIKIKASWCCFHLLKRVFKCAFDRFATACYQVELKISAERPGYYVLSQCMQQVSGDISQQFEISKNVEWCSRATVGRTRLIRGSTDWWSKRSSAWPLAFPCHKTGALKHCKDVSFKLVFIPILTYGKKSWVMTERMLFQAQAAAIGFLRRVHGVTHRDKARSCEIRKTLNAESLLRIVRSQQWWFGHLTRMPKETLASQVLLHGYAHGKVAQRSAKDQAVWLHLRFCLVPSWCGASRTSSQFPENSEIFPEGFFPLRTSWELKMGVKVKPTS